MKRQRKRKCKNCQDYFHPDARVAQRQKFCSKPACRNASKAHSQRRWLSKPHNRDYFRGPTQVHRVQQWRQAHPGYWRGARAKTETALQDELTAQVADLPTNLDTFANVALQDLMVRQPFVLIGLLANLSGSTLQDEISAFAHRLHTLGVDIVNPTTEGESHDSETFTQSTAVPSRSSPIQLGGSAPGTR
jgi:hypothetical protein